MMCDSSSTASLTVFALGPKDPAATPKNTEKTTICRISLLAIASNALRGTRWVTNSLSDIDEVLRLEAAPASGCGRFNLAPGCKALTCAMHRSSDLRYVTW